MKQVLCFGDSNTWGFWETDIKRFPWEIRWTGRVQAELGRNWRVIEEGLSSRTIAVEDKVQTYRSGIEYLEPCIMSHHPLELIVIMLGSNDTKCRYHLSPGEIGLEMDELLKKLKNLLYWMESQETKILLVSPAPIVGSMPFDAEMDGTSIEKVRKLPVIFEEIAEKHDVEYMDAGKFVHDYQADGLHFSAEGHRQFAEGMMQKIREMFPV